MGLTYPNSNTLAEGEWHHPAWHAKLKQKLFLHHKEGIDTAVDNKKAAKLGKDLGHEDPPTPPPIDTSDLYSASSWFNQVRLLLVRARRVLSLVFGWAFLGNPILKRIFDVASLYFALELAVDIVMIVKATFFNAKDEEKDLPFLERLKLAWARFKHIFLKDERPRRMVNAAFSLALNLAGIIVALVLTGPALPLVVGIIGLASCVIDVVLEVAKGAWAYFVHRGLLNKINHAIETTTDEAHKGALNVLKRKVEEKMKADLISCIRPFVFMVIMLVAMGFFFFPPLALPLAALIGAGVALFVGSIIGGLGRKAYFALGLNKYMDKYVFEPLEELWKDIYTTIKGWFKKPENPSAEPFPNPTSSTQDLYSKMPASTTDAPPPQNIPNRDINEEIQGLSTTPIATSTPSSSPLTDKPKLFSSEPIPRRRGKSFAEPVKPAPLFEM